MFDINMYELSNLQVNIRHLKNIGPLGLAYLTNMYNRSLNNNVILHTWKLSNIIPIPKPNKDMSIGASYRPITINIPHISTQHGFKNNHSISTELHNINNTITWYKTDHWAVLAFTDQCTDLGTRTEPFTLAFCE